MGPARRHNMLGAMKDYARQGWDRIVGPCSRTERLTSRDTTGTGYSWGTGGPGAALRRAGCMASRGKDGIELQAGGAAVPGRACPSACPVTQSRWERQGEQAGRWTRAGRMDCFAWEGWLCTAGRCAKTGRLISLDAITIDKARKAGRLRVQGGQA